MNHQKNETIQLSRRAFVKGGTLFLASSATIAKSLLAGDDPQNLQFGLVTDLHYADKPSAGSRHYRESLEKLSAAAGKFSESKLSFVVELGDFIDAAESVEEELAYLKRINKDFAAINEHRHYVLGNHCVYTLTKKEFLKEVAQDKSYYSFDDGDFHFVVLDSCFCANGDPYGRRNFEWTDTNVPAAELEWLAADLNDASKKTIVFAHQRLDVDNAYGVKNCDEVRAVLEDSKKVLAVFQGHNHKNDHKEINGIHYCTLVAMVEGTGAASNGFSIVSVSGDGSIGVSGFLNQDDYNWPR